MAAFSRFGAMKTVRDAAFETMRQFGLTTIFGNPVSTDLNIDHQAIVVGARAQTPSWHPFGWYLLGRGYVGSAKFDARSLCHGINLYEPLIHGLRAPEERIERRELSGCLSRVTLSGRRRPAGRRFELPVEKVVVQPERDYQGEIESGGDRDHA